MQEADIHCPGPGGFWFWDKTTPLRSTWTPGPRPLFVVLLAVKTEDHRALTSVMHASQAQFRQYPMSSSANKWQFDFCSDVKHRWCFQNLARAGALKERPPACPHPESLGRVSWEQQTEQLCKCKSKSLIRPGLKYPAKHIKLESLKILKGCCF